MKSRTTSPSAPFGLAARSALAIFAAFLVWTVAHSAEPASAQVAEPAATTPTTPTTAPPAPTTSATPKPVRMGRFVKTAYGSRIMRVGMRGTDVQKLQKLLIALQLPVSSADAAFGPTTKKAVIAFERSRTLPVDGKVQRKQAKRIRAIAKRKRVPASGSFLFPVPAPHTYSLGGGAFGAARPGRTHQGQDVGAACGSPVIAAQGGTVKASSYQAEAAGYYAVITGSTTGEDYMYAHLTGPSAIGVGVAIAAGQQISTVGQTGNATGCILHFEMWTVPGWYSGGAPYDPLPSLQSWDNYS